MSLHATGQCAIYLHSFNYIALPVRGLCCFRLSLARTPFHPDFHSQPYSLYQLCPDESPTRLRLSRSRLEDEDREYCSKVFYLKHSNEEVMLQDVCLFRLDLPLGVSFKCGTLEIQAKLMFSEVSIEESFDKDSLRTRPSSEFQEIAQGKLTLNLADSGLHESFPLIFEFRHLVVIRLDVHLACIDYRVVVPEQLQNVSGIQTFTKLIFGDLAFREALKAQEIDKTYQTCVQNLRLTHERIRYLLETIYLKETGERPTAIENKYNPVLPLPPLPLQLPLLVKVGPVPLQSSEVSQGVFMFSDQVPSYHPEKVASLILKEIHEVSLYLIAAFNLLLEWYRLRPDLCYEHFYELFFEKLSSYYGEFFFREIHTVESVPVRYQDNMQKLHARVASVRRKSKYSQSISPLPVQDSILLDRPELIPIVFEDAYQRANLPYRSLRTSTAPISMEGLHIFVLVHGLGARAADMNRCADHIYLLHPCAIVLASAVNEGLTDGDILEMGARLAQEVLYYIKSMLGVDGSMKRLSFIGHSLGGLIIRAALPLLSEYQDRMHLYLSLSTPHLGCMYSTSRLIAAGLWFYSKKWFSIQQMAMKDSAEMTESALYRLSGYEGLKWFSHLVLCSSPQDQYTPFCSARIEVSDEALRDGKRGCTHMDMALRLLDGIPVEKIRRLDVSFKVKKADINSAIGRSAHVEMLQNEMVMKLILFRYPELFA